MLANRIVLLVTLMAAILIVAACSPAGGPAEQTPIPTLAPAAEVTLVPSIAGGTGAGATSAGGGQPSAATGAALYLLHCTPCHGNQGQGVDAPALRNNQYVQSASDDALESTVAQGVPGSEMPAWLQANGGPLTNGDIANVAAYVRTMQNVPENATLAPDAGPAGPAATMTGDAANGQPLFGAICAFCHGPEGVQGLPNPGSTDESVPVVNPIDPEIASSDAQTFAQNVDLYIEHGSLPEGDNPLLLMPPFGDRHMLSDEQIADLIAYVLQLNGVQP